MTMLRNVFRVAIVGEVTEEQAGLVINDIGVEYAMELLSDAVKVAMAKPEPGSRPRKRGGTGKLIAVNG
jgi:hypothetical protein